LYENNKDLYENNKDLYENNKDQIYYFRAARKQNLS